MHKTRQESRGLWTKMFIEVAEQYNRDAQRTADESSGPILARETAYQIIWSDSSRSLNHRTRCPQVGGSLEACCEPPYSAVRSECLIDVVVGADNGRNVVARVRHCRRETNEVALGTAGTAVCADEQEPQMRFTRTSLCSPSAARYGTSLSA